MLFYAVYFTQFGYCNFSPCIYWKVNYAYMFNKLPRSTDKSKKFYGSLGFNDRVVDLQCIASVLKYLLENVDQSAVESVSKK